jgi:hypothetical protein
VAKLLLALALVLGAHFAMTFNVPARVGKAWLGWPFAIGDSGRLGAVIGRSGARTPLTAALAAGATAGFVLAILSLFGLWVPQRWWQLLATVAALLSLVLMGFFLRANKLVAIAIDLIVIAVSVVSWTAVLGG